MHAFRRRTDGRTDISLVAKTALYPVQRGEKVRLHIYGKEFALQRCNPLLPICI